MRSEMRDLLVEACKRTALRQRTFARMKRRSCGGWALNRISGLLGLLGCCIGRLAAGSVSRSIGLIWILTGFQSLLLIVLLYKRWIRYRFGESD